MLGNCIPDDPAGLLFCRSLVGGQAGRYSHARCGQRAIQDVDCRIMAGVHPEPAGLPRMRGDRPP